MRTSIIRTIVPVSIVVMLLTGAAFLAAYVQQVRQRDDIFELEKALDEIYRIQLTESRLSSEAYHYQITGRQHNLEAFQIELKDIQLHISVLESFELDQIVDRSLESGILGLHNWIAQLDSLVKLGPIVDQSKSDRYLRGSSYVELRHKIFAQFDKFEQEATGQRELMMLRLGRLTQINMIGFLVMLLLAVLFVILTYRINSASLKQTYQLQLQRKEQEFETSFLHALVGIAIIDEDGNFVRLNTRLCQILGYSENELRERTFLENSPPFEIEVDRQVLQGLANGELVLNEREKQMIHISGQTIWVKQSMAMLPTEGRVRKNFIVQLNDITREKESWQRLQDSNIELEQFAYTASHDLKEPLRMIDGFMSLLEKNYAAKLDESARKYIHFASDGARRMNQLLEDLLSYSRATRLSTRSELTDLNQVIKGIRQMYQPLIDEKKAVIVSKDLPTVWVPPVAVKTVLQNLISNGLKYHRAGVPPQLVVDAIDKGSHWYIEVSDEGIGIDPTFHERIFVVFQRLHSRQEIEGSGIGLATCKRLVEKWGGRIGLGSAPGMGSQFYFTIPKNSSSLLSDD